MRTEHGLVPKGQGWFVLNARDAQWWEREGPRSPLRVRGRRLRGCARLRAARDQPHRPRPRRADGDVPLGRRTRRTSSCWCGEAVLVMIEGEERQLRTWDFVHCPAGTQHVIVGAGDEPCVLLCVGARGRSTGSQWGAYTVDEAALRHGAGVERETTEPREAYSRFSPGRPDPVPGRAAPSVARTARHARRGRRISAASRRSCR